MPGCSAIHADRDVGSVQHVVGPPAFSRDTSFGAHCCIPTYDDATDGGLVKAVLERPLVFGACGSGRVVVSLLNKRSESDRGLCVLRERMPEEETGIGLRGGSVLVDDGLARHVPTQHGLQVKAASVERDDLGRLGALVRAVRLSLDLHLDRQHVGTLDQTLFAEAASL